MKRFNRRTYKSFAKMLSDFSKVVAERKQIRPLIHGNLIDPAFRERLMLVVTSVNQCRYCSYIHSKLAVMQDITLEEIHDLCVGALDKCPEEELPALLYAQHWVEVDGNPQLEVRQRIVNVYGEEKTCAIEFCIRLINIANLLGNGFDLILYILSFGNYEVNRTSRTVRTHVEHL